LKSNETRSLTFTDDIISVFQSIEGGSINRKFQRIVNHYAMSRKTGNRSIAEITSKLENLQLEYDLLYKRFSEFNRLYVSMVNLNNNMIDFNTKLENVLVGKLPSGANNYIDVAVSVPSDNYYCPCCKLKFGLSIARRHSFKCRDCNIDLIFNSSSIEQNLDIN